MSILTGEDLTNIVLYEGTEAAIEKLKISFDKVIATDIVKYLRLKNCPEPEYCAEEVIQDTWKVIYLDIEKYRRGLKTEKYINPAGWVFRIHRRFCIKNILKHIKDRNIISLEEFDNPNFVDDKVFLLYPFDNIIESKLYRLEILKCIRKEILHLPKPQLIAFELFMNDFTHTEISFFLNITPDCSRQWISRTIRKLRKAMKKF